MEISKINVKGTEYDITDKAAQVAIDSLTKEVEELKSKQGKLVLIDID